MKNTQIVNKMYTLIEIIVLATYLMGIILLGALSNYNDNCIVFVCLSFIADQMVWCKVCEFS